MSAIFHFNRWQVAWLLVYCSNLIAPLLLAWQVTKDGGRIGMFVAIVVFWLVGHVICGQLKVAAYIFVYGGFFVALSQFYPVLHMFSGVAALGLCRYDFVRADGVSEFAGFIATIFTGLQLLTIASVIGSGIWARFGREDNLTEAFARQSADQNGTPPETAVIDLSTSRLITRRPDSLS